MTTEPAVPAWNAKVPRLNQLPLEGAVLKLTGTVVEPPSKLTVTGILLAPEEKAANQIET